MKETIVFGVRMKQSLLDALKEQAEQEQRTVTGQILYILGNAVQPVPNAVKYNKIQHTLDAVSTGHGKISLPVTVSAPEEAAKVARVMKPKSPAPLLKYVAPTRDNLPGPRRSSKGKPEPVKQSSGMIQRRELPGDSTAHEEYRAKAERLKRLATLTA